jgi:hypothetical protein
MVVQGWTQSPWEHEKKANFRRMVEGFSAGEKNPAMGRKYRLLEKGVGGRMDCFWRGGVSVCEEAALPVRVHIRFRGNGHLGFRPYGGLLCAFQSDPL